MDPIFLQINLNYLHFEFLSFSSRISSTLIEVIFRCSFLSSFEIDFKYTDSSSPLMFLSLRICYKIIFILVYFICLLLWVKYAFFFLILQLQSEGWVVLLLYGHFFSYIPWISFYLSFVNIWFVIIRSVCYVVHFPYELL